MVLFRWAMLRISCIAERKRSLTYSLTSLSVPSADQHAPVAAAQAQAGQVFLVHGDHPLAAALDKDHIGLDQPRLLAVVQAARAWVEGADELDAGVRFGGGDLGGPGQVFHVPLLQQVQVAVHDQRGHFHGCGAALRACASASARKLRWGSSSSSGCRFGVWRGVELGKLLLLRGNLDHQALAQIARAHAGRIEMLHQVDGARFDRSINRRLPTAKVAASRGTGRESRRASSSSLTAR